MVFTKGHTQSQGPRRPGGGDKKMPSTLVKEAIDGLRNDLPELFEQLKQKALAGDREACIYLIDRAIGKPKANLEIEGVDKLGDGVILNLLTIFAQQRLNKPVIQLEEGKDATEQD